VTKIFVAIGGEKRVVLAGTIYIFGRTNTLRIHIGMAGTIYRTFPNSPFGTHTHTHRHTHTHIHTQAHTRTHTSHDAGIFYCVFILRLRGCPGLRKIKFGGLPNRYWTATSHISHQPHNTHTFWPGFSAALEPRLGLSTGVDGNTDTHTCTHTHTHSHVDSDSNRGKEQISSPSDSAYP